MNTVGKLGSYISRSVYTVSGPFHPFGGAVDIVVVEQKDGSFKSSPWYVRFGKFQGVLKAKEKVVSINVNGVEAGFHMYLDHKGEAYFLREADVEEGDTLLSPSSSGEDTDGQSSKRMPVKSKSCNCAAYESDSVTEIGISNLRVASRTKSRRSRIMGLVFGRKSVKQGLPEQDNEAGFIRTDSLDRAELAADLLEMKWSTNLVSSRCRKDTTSLLSSQDTSEVNACEEIQITDEQDNVGCLINDTLVDNLNNCVPVEKIGSTNDEKDHSSHAFPMRPEKSDEETGIEMSCLVPGSLLGKSRVPDDGKTNLENQSKTGSLLDDDADGGAISIDIIPKVASAECGIQDSLNLEFSPAYESTKGLFSNENRAGSPDSSLSMDESEAKSVPLFLSSETSMSSRFDLDAEQANGTTCVSSGKCEQSFLATVQTIDLVCEVNSNSGTSLDEKEPSRIDKVLEKNDYFISSDNCKSPESPGISSDSMQKDVISQTYSQKVSLQPSYGSVEVEPRSIVTVSSFSNSICQPLVDKSMSKENEGNDFEPPVEHSQISKIDHPVLPNVLLTEILEEEQLFFGDLDDLKGIDQGDAEDSIIHTCSSSADKSGCENLPDDAGVLRRTLKTISSEVNIPVTGRSQSEEVPRIVKSLPNMWSHDSGFYVHYNDHKLPKGPNETEDVKSIEQLKTGVNPIVGDSSIPFDASNRSWRIWSFPFKKSQSFDISQSSLNGNSSDSEIIGNKEDAIEDEKAMPKTKATKKKIRVTTPTSQQVASLNLKEGRNTVVFTFSTPMLGKQQVDARIYLWKWDTRIVISDVDGTITRSDLLGQVMPLVGVDWSQTGVAHLFSAIKENGYQFLFLSARAISQAYHTRQFLFNLKQDGKALPYGPVLISPDGLFPSLYREVVRRAPHEFKISCLEDIKALFPPDRNPFYAGFGNRDTDEFSYLKVGIPKGKIFIINPKGQVVVNRRLDTKSYTSFHALVNDMFPSRTSFEQEDYNSWNFWKLPPPDIDI